MVAFHVQRGVGVPLSAPLFYAGLREKFIEREGMFFLTDQVASYDRQRSRVADIRQQDFFVHDEATAIQWLYRELTRRPQTLQDLHPAFTREVQSWSKHERAIELLELLDENFLRYDGKGLLPSQIHSYLSSNFKELRNREKEDSVLVEKATDRWYVPDPSKQADLDKLREKTLLREFSDYRDSAQRRLRQFRTEAIRAGFKAAYETHDYATIVSVAAKLPENVLQEDDKLLMYFDVATMRLGGE